MNDERQQTKAWFLLLERVTSAVLLLVILLLGWILLAAYQPDWLRLPHLEMEVIVILALLAAALLLVSVVALLQTRSGDRREPP